MTDMHLSHADILRSALEQLLAEGGDLKDAVMCAIGAASIDGFADAVNILLTSKPPSTGAYWDSKARTWVEVKA